MSDDIFFCIKPISSEAGFDAIMLVGEYDLKFTLSDYVDSLNPGVIVVHDDNSSEVVPLPDGGHKYHAGNYRLCEIAFQMNYRQIGMVCPVCKKEGLDTCGHLTFSRAFNTVL